MTKAISYDQNLPEAIVNASTFENQLRTLGTTYVDAYITHDHHALAPDHVWDTMVRERHRGRMRAIGSGGHHRRTGVDVVQARLGPCGVGNVNLVQLMAQNATLINVDLTNKCTMDPVVRLVALQKGKSPYQILIRWALQLGTPVLICSKSLAHLREDLDVVDFELNLLEMTLLESVRYLYNMDKGAALVNPGADLFGVKGTH